MKQLEKVAKTLGPKGLMPNPKNETVAPNVKKAVEDLGKGKIAFRSDDTANVHVTLGKSSFEDIKLIENYKAFMDALTKAKPSTMKGTFIQNITMTSSMGPAIKVELK